MTHTGGCLCGGITFQIDAPLEPIEPTGVRVAWHAYTASSSSWWPVTDGLPQHAGAYVPPEPCER